MKKLLCSLLLVSLLLSASLFAQKKIERKNAKPDLRNSKPAAIPSKPITPPAPSRPRTPAERVAGILQDFITSADLRTRGKNPAMKAVNLSESDVNEYVRYAIRAKTRFGVKSIHIKLIGPNYLGVTTTVDFDKVKVDDSSFAVKMVQAILTGEKQIYLEGFARSSNGKGQFQLEKAYFGNLRLPVYFMDKVINYLGHRQNPPIDTSKPAPLPYGLKKLDVTTGSIALLG